MAGKERLTVIVSSTARDLPEHRKEVMDACLRQGMFPEMMEQLPASDADAIRASLALVDGADIYVGVFAHRYGYVPKGYDISVTEMEYNHAFERKIPRLIFLMHEDHPVKAADVEKGEDAVKLEELKKRLSGERVVNFFKSPAELRANVIDSLSEYRKGDVTAFHYVGDIPAPPEPYIAHPYTLLQSKGLIGRQAELNLLTDWVVKPAAEVYQARILNVVAIGGMGKSALTWKWFNDIAPQELKPNGREWDRMWWSFYESDATFENFVTRALAYVARRPREEVEKVPAPDREEQLLAALDREPHLVVLDGLERILIAYARMDAARLSDDDLDERTANRVARAVGLPESAAESFVGQHRLRKTADPRAGSFLRKLSRVRASRILVSTRLYPADLQAANAEPIPGCTACFLRGLSDDDALDLWRAFGVSGARDTLLPLFNKFENHALLVQALASEVGSYRRAPGDFDRWRQSHPDFNPYALPLVQVKSHVLAFALRGLSETSRKVLQAIAAFRMPATYDTLAALFVGEGKLFPSETRLDTALAELEDRGLLGWDRRANRYDLHPIVRGVVWSRLDETARRSTYGNLETHFKALPPVEQEKVGCLEDLTSAVELYNTLIGLRRYDDAYVVFRDRLSDATLYRLSASRQHAELLETLFPDGLGQLPRLKQASHQAFTLNALAQAYNLGGQPGRAVPLYRTASEIADRERERQSLSVGLCNLSDAFRSAGSLRESEAAARRALSISRELRNDFREAISLYWLGLTLAARGAAEASEASLQRSLRMFVAQSHVQFEGVVTAYLAQRALWLGDPGAARTLANRAWELARSERYERDFIGAARLQGAAALALGDLTTADERLHHALTRARAVNLVEEELPALADLAELRRRQGDLKAARELLEDVWESAERGPYPLLHADALNVLAQIERDAGNHAAAVDAATKAYRLAWCDGPPYAYHWGLEAAKKHLRELGAPEPTGLPPFDESKYEPMPEVEINPADELGSIAN
jgi:tetratricopeptide (TPR) repeat protein